MMKTAARIARTGMSVLQATKDPPKKSAKYTVKIFYRSEGGDVLSCHSGSLTRNQADSLVNDMKRSLALGVCIVRDNSVVFHRGLTSSDRSVLLPHQYEILPLQIRRGA